MKPIARLFLLVSLALCVAGCHQKDKPEATHTDTLATAHREGDSIEVFIVDTLTGDTEKVHMASDDKVIKLPVDREEKAKRQARGAATRTKGIKATADQSIFDVRGPVKQINYTQGFLGSYNQVVEIDEVRDLVNFSPDGQWQPSAAYTVKRDKEGRIVSATRKADGIVNEFTYRGALLQSVKVYKASQKNISSTARLKRDKNGFVDGYNASVLFPGDNATLRVKVKVLERDRYGNWLRRRFRTLQETRIEEREIEYRK